VQPFEMLLLIDNYDSFAYNLVHYLGELGAECRVERNDAIDVDEALSLNPEAIVLSPGPRTPDDAGICVELARAAAGRVPVLGVCLGHQSIAQAFGARIVRAPEPMHGKPTEFSHDGTGVFRDLDDPVTAIRYHSLTVDPDSVPECLTVTARTGDGVIMGIAHCEFPIHGVQFHPESIDTRCGHQLLRNFLDLIREGKKAA
jgi:anthranilate synthase component 2